RQKLPALNLQTRLIDAGSVATDDFSKSLSRLPARVTLDDDEAPGNKFPVVGYTCADRQNFAQLRGAGTRLRKEGHAHRTSCLEIVNQGFIARHLGSWRRGIRL